MIASEKPTFRIIEGSSSNIDYEEFKDDFLNPYVTVDDIKEKYDIRGGDYNYYRKMVLEETGLKKKPCFTSSNHTSEYAKTNPNQFEFIRKQNSSYLVVKTIYGITRYYGRYRDYETAKMVRDKLVASGWDETLGALLKQQYGLQRRYNSVVSKAEEVYESFKDYYVNSSLTVIEICELLGISQRCYAYLVKMLREDNVPQRARRDYKYKEIHV